MYNFFSEEKVKVKKKKIVFKELKKDYGLRVNKFFLVFLKIIFLGRDWVSFYFVYNWV